MREVNGMLDFKVIITFSDNEFLTENITSSSNEKVFEELLTRMKNEWFRTSNGAKITYRNPTSIVKIEIIDIKENDLTAKERTQEFRELAKNLVSKK